MKSISDANLISGQRVLVRADLDIPLSPTGDIEEEFRLDASLPTLKIVLDKKCIPVICGHLGRPDGVIVPKLSSSVLKKYFDSHLGEGTYKLLENLRFNPGEENNDANFAAELAKEGDVYVNECFGTSHREHASIVGVPKILPSYSGINLANEVKNLTQLLQASEKPFVAVIGGAKLETKKPVINKFLTLADKVLIGGKIGLDWQEEIPQNLMLPVDYLTDEKDIGENTIKMYEEIIVGAKTIVWAGPMGMFEDASYGEGTKRIGDAIVKSSAYTVVGGGDTILALRKFNLFEGISFISSGGGAMLEFLVKGNLPGLEALGYHG